MADEDKDGEIVIRLKPYWKSKNLWAAIFMFLISFLTVIGTFPAIMNSPRLSGIVGMAFSFVWILLRIVTNQAIYPSVNMPNLPPAANAPCGPPPATVPPIVGCNVPDPSTWTK